MISPPPFLGSSGWKSAAIEPVTGDASTRRYFRLRDGAKTTILMDASRSRDSIPPFIRINQHLQALDFSVPAILARDEANGFLLLEDFGDETFARLLDQKKDAEALYALATDVLIALHQKPDAAPPGLRSYSAQKMREDVELFLEVAVLPERAQAEFKQSWDEVLSLAHAVPSSLLLRDYHVANLMWLPGRAGIRRAGLLDFQDAYAGPVTYDLVSLLEDARRDLPAVLKEKMTARYLAQFPSLDRKTFDTSWAILAALRHTRVLAVFEKLDRDGKPDYKKLHSPRVKRMLQAALEHPTLAALKHWFATYGG